MATIIMKLVCILSAESGNVDDNPYISESFLKN